jgi:hypothetical protein
MTRTAGSTSSALGALAQSIAPDRLSDEDDGQLALLGFDADSEGQYAQHTVAGGPRRPGRPLGPTAMSRDLARMLAHRGYRHPVEFLASIVSMDTRELAAKLAGSGGKAELVTFDQAEAVLNLQLKAAKEAALYVAQQMPKAVEVRTDAPRAVVVIHEGDHQGGPGGDRRAMSVHEIDHVEYQGVSRSANGKSHDEQSHEQANPLEDQDNPP